MTEINIGGASDAVPASAQPLDAVVTKDPQGVITGWSPVAQDLYGYRPEEIIGRDASVLFPAGWQCEEEDLVRRATAGERIAPYSTNRVHKDGSIITVLLAMSAIVDRAGAVVGVASTSRPASGVAPATAAPHVPQEDRERLQAQLEQAQRLEGLGQLAGGARREVIQPQVVDINDVLINMAAILRRTLGADLSLVTHLGEALPPVLVDPGQMDQVILNLAVNARDAMPDGGSLTITTDSLHVDRAFAAEWSSVLPGPYVRVEITDTGTGMSAEVVKHAFEPFYTTKSKGSGTGLGLATVYGAVTQAEGHIRVQSRPGTGTTFTILLPVTTQSAADAEQTPPHRHASQGQTVLLIEDEDALREVTRRLLSRQGYNVITASNGADAIDAAHLYPGTIDLLLTDVIMPRMHGKEAAEKITQTRPGIRVLYMSGYAQPILARQGRLDPNVALLDKPFTERALLAKVSAMLRPQTTAHQA